MKTSATFFCSGRVDPRYTTSTTTLPIQLLAAIDTDPIDARLSCEGTTFPWHAKDEIVLAFLHADLDSPIVLGAHHSLETPNPVNIQNRQHNTLRTKQGHTFLLCDDPLHPHITLQTAQHHRIEWDRTAAHLFVHAPKGQVQSHAETTTHFHVAHHFIQTSAHDLLYRVRHDHHTYAATMKYRSGQHVALLASHTLHLLAQVGPTTVQVQGNSALHAFKHLAFKSTRAQWISDQGSVEINSGKALHLQGKQMTLLQDHACIQITESDITLCASHITFRAPRIILRSQIQNFG